MAFSKPGFKPNPKQAPEDRTGKREIINDVNTRRIDTIPAKEEGKAPWHKLYMDPKALLEGIEVPEGTTKVFAHLGDLDIQQSVRLPETFDYNVSFPKAEGGYTEKVSIPAQVIADAYMQGKADFAGHGDVEQVVTTSAKASQGNIWLNNATPMNAVNAPDKGGQHYNLGISTDALRKVAPELVPADAAEGKMFNVWIDPKFVQTSINMPRINEKDAYTIGGVEVPAGEPNRVAISFENADGVIANGTMRVMDLRDTYKESEKIIGAKAKEYQKEAESKMADALGKDEAEAAAPEIQMGE